MLRTIIFAVSFIAVCLAQPVSVLGTNARTVINDYYQNVKGIGTNLPAIQIKPETKDAVDYIFSKLNALIATLTGFVGALLVLANRVERIGNLLPFFKVQNMRKVRDRIRYRKHKKQA